MDALLAFAAALVSLRLSAKLASRFGRSGRAEYAAWSAGLAAYALAAAALAWGAAYGWTDAAFRAYYLGGALLTAPLLGAGSLLLAGRRRAAPLALAYVGADAVQSLTDTLKGPNRDARAAAAYALGQIGGAAAAATETLVKALKDDDKEVRRQSAQALGRILAGAKPTPEPKPLTPPVPIDAPPPGPFPPEKPPS